MAKAKTAAAHKDADPAPGAGIPVLGGLVTYVTVDGAAKAAKFYEKPSAPKRCFAIRSTTRAGPCTSICTSTAAPSC